MPKITDSCAENSKFTATQFAVYKHVWILAASDIQLLDKHYIMRATGETLVNRLNQQHEYQDSITHDNSWWLVSWSACGLETAKRNPNALFLLSFRKNVANNMYFVVIRKAYEQPEAIAKAMKYSEFTGSK